MQGWLLIPQLRKEKCVAGGFRVAANGKEEAMEGVLWFLAYGVLFYFMMRYGCGAHMVHGHGGHKGHAATGKTDAKFKDPVCGMEVAPLTGYSRGYEGREYRFCSRQCLDQFDAAPARYVSQ